MKRKSLVAFISLFILLLVLPNGGLFREKRNAQLIAEMENRTISGFPSLRLLSKEFYQGLELWYGDRILGRNKLIHLWSQINGSLFDVLISKEIVKGKESYYFSPFNASSEMRDQECKLVSYVKMKALVEQSGARFIMFVAPHAEWAVPELLPDDMAKPDLQRIEQHQVELFDKKGFERYSFNLGLAQLNLSDRKRLYPPGDYHWSREAGFLAAKGLLRQLGLAENIEQPIYFEEGISSGEIYTRKVGLKGCKSKVRIPWNDGYNKNYEIRRYIAGVETKDEISGHKGEVVYINSQASHKVKVLWMGDSFEGAMHDYLMQDIGTLINCHNSDLGSPKKKIDIQYMLDFYKPDIVVYEKAGLFMYGNTYDESFSRVQL